MAPVVPFGTGPAEFGSCVAERELTDVPDGIRRFWGGGTPWRDRWKALILACMSWGRPPPLVPDMDDGGGAGLRAALRVPRGVDEEVMFREVGPSVGFRNEGSRIGEGLEVGFAKSLAAEASGETISGGSADAGWVSEVGSMTVMTEYGGVMVG